MRRREFIALAGGTLVAWPATARAQQPAMPVIGFLHAASPVPYAHLVLAFHRGLKEAGYVAGQNVAIEYRWADNQYDRLPELAADPVARQVAVIHASSYAMGAAKAATATIPIVFNSGGDPVKLGLVTSLSRPGGNVTGVSWLSVELEAKHVELLHELIPTAGIISVLLNRATPGAETYERLVQQAARAIGLQVRILSASNEGEIDSAFGTVASQRTGPVLVITEFLFLSRREHVAAMAAHYGVPAIYGLREFVDAGGLISYGASLADAYRQSGIYVGRILKGAKPADLPVIQPTKLELVIDLKTARALGLTIPPSLLARADEVIE
jgi:putative tryptophan/tyrosine transport system substrate-binding protein